MNKNKTLLDILDIFHSDYIVALRYSKVEGCLPLSGLRQIVNLTILLKQKWIQEKKNKSKLGYIR